MGVTGLGRFPSLARSAAAVNPEIGGKTGKNPGFAALGDVCRCRNVTPLKAGSHPVTRITSQARSPARCETLSSLESLSVISA